MRSRTVGVISAAWVLGLAAATAHAQEEGPIRPRDPANARSVALAGGGALQIGTGAVQRNPAALGLTRAYQMESFGFYDPDSTAVTLGAAIADSFSNRIGIGMGVSYAYTFTDEEHGDLTAHDVRLAFALPLGPTAALGVTGRYLSVDAQVAQADAPPEVTEIVDTLTLDASFALRLGERVWLAAMGENLTDTGSPWAPLRLGAAAAVLPIDVLSLGVDASFDMTSFENPAGRYAAYGELLAGARFPLRLGYTFDDGRDVHTVSGGLGYVDQRFALDLSLRQDVTGASETLLAAGFRVFVR